MPQRGEGRQVASVSGEAPRPPAVEVLPAEPIMVREQRPPVTGYIATRGTPGTKIKLPLLDVPQLIQIVPRQVIDDQRAITLSDVFRNVSGFAPGVSSQSQRFGDRKAIFRGFTTNNYHTNGFKDAFNGTSFTYGLANGVKLDLFGGRIAATFAVYHLTKENVLTPDPDHLGFSIQIGEQRSRRVEVDIAGEVRPGLRLIGSYAYTDAEITRSNDGTERNRPANVPEHTGSVWGVYEFGDVVVKGLGLGLDVIAVGRRPADYFDTVTLPSYVRTDAAIYYRPWKHLDLAHNFKNLCDVWYFETSTFADPDAGISPGVPSSVFGTVTARY